ncbi:PREDICTED: RNA-dependent RNA polymerase 6-like [Nelumbo nucifera]|uniref:RNA-dependent RNA polymerase n=1 Tax=Nelumbo nucifera TaxID=4432 RepID=A0A1U7Z9H7_NELNU|nr:PREDICTED: RNA-dependent RNA polymerase 6-like [Nelumbo nucifera]
MKEEPRTEMVLEGTKNGMVVSQASFGGFDKNVTALELTDFLEQEIGGIWRCRLKTSWTPPDSYPDFDVTNMKEIQKTDDYEKVKPHAFVHFISPEAATAALKAAGRCELVMNHRPLKVNLEPESPFRINQMRRADPFKLPDSCIEIGSLVAQDEFVVCWKAPCVDFVVDPFDLSCKIMFTRETAFSIKDKHAVIKCDFKLEFFVRDINYIKQYTQYTGSSSLVILLQLASSPCIYYRTADDDIYDSFQFDMLDDEDPWIRTTDFTPSRAIGRCNSYRISVAPRFGLRLKKVVNYLREHRIPDECLRGLLRIREEPDFGKLMADSFFSIDHEEGLSFEVIFMVNAIVHKGIISQNQLSKEFFDLLRTEQNEVNVTALQHMYSYRRPVINACKSLRDVQTWFLDNPKLIKSSKESDDSVEVRRLVITPTRAYCLPPEVELSNRVLRKYKHVSDRFLRVSFKDERMQQLSCKDLIYHVSPIVKDIKSKSFTQKTTVFNRVKTILTNGFSLCGRKYSLLAFSSNQLRDRSAWFFAEDKNTAVMDVKKWMGKFANRNVAKCAARMGQCFSSTYATVEVPLKNVNLGLPDIERNGYVFSDGIGMLTPDLAIDVAEKLQLTTNPPCAYQIRYAGCKGVVVCWPAAAGEEDGIRLSLRPSMNKFESGHTTLEVCSWTRFQPGYLNRQIITLLSALSVPDDVFSRLQDSMVSKLNQMLDNADVAFDVVTSLCPEQGKTAAIMLSAGFQPQMEPHLKGMLSCIRAAQLRDLLEKSKIFVPAGRLLMGCLDELAVLEEGQCFIQVSTPSLENCFSKNGFRFSKAKKNVHVIEGIVAIAKNPCLHPGDVRILKAVDVPGLHHLVDCLVFPQKGERPHTNEASGSDLDGDLYFVTWDEHLIPPSKQSWMPMDYSPVEARKMSREVNHHDLIKFFMKTMVNEKLGVICNAHVVHADLSEYGALDKKCIRLAELAAKAVDFPKTGEVVTMPQSLKPKMYPDFMGKEDFLSYRSSKILGKLYRKIRDIDSDNGMATSSEMACVAEDISYDTDLEILGSAGFVTDAWNQKCSYDAQFRALLGQYKVIREEEVVTGHIWSMPKYNSNKQGELKERLKHAYNVLKKEFRQAFESMDETFAIQLTEDEKNSVYEKKASAWYQVTYHPKWVMKTLKLREHEDDSMPPMLSFAWIPADYLVRIKIKHQNMEKVDIGKPINALASYLARQM